MTDQSPIEHRDDEEVADLPLAEDGVQQDPVGTPARRPRTRPTIPYRPPAVGYSAPSSAQPTARQPLIIMLQATRSVRSSGCW
jgi:hypothetical protein